MAFLALWRQGDLLIKCIALFLLGMSVASWYLIATHTLRILRFHRMTNGIARFWTARNLEEGFNILSEQGKNNPFLQLALEANLAVQCHASRENMLKNRISLPELLTESLRGVIDDSTLCLQSGLSILASIGSTAPFIGLLGTVWGIYHALTGISASGQASIDQIAGPVGEALIMTALGLAVAIPAVLGYNTLVRSNRHAIGWMNRFARQLHAYFLIGTPSGQTGTISFEERT
ncbi:MAG: MotA/TolQ/ExbB proton channel family protein [Oxalobacter formigenes]|nr:MotA/TolQ/ExbB proton channel family protein [Oxalobacter formigenes]